VSTWIINSSPLILLGKIGRLELLPSLGASIKIPQAVSKEILGGPHSDPAKGWLEQQGKSFVIPDVPIPIDILAWDLGPGESSVISIAQLCSTSVCVLDDRAARNCAQVYGLKITGTLGILLKAKALGFIPRLIPEIENLLRVGSALSPRVIQEAIALAGESPMPSG
jgi:predicted nucleic acid-binding protein